MAVTFPLMFVLEALQMLNDCNEIAIYCNGSNYNLKPLESNRNIKHSVTGAPIM